MGVKPGLSLAGTVLVGLAVAGCQHSNSVAPPNRPWTPPPGSAAQNSNPAARPGPGSNFPASPTGFPTGNSSSTFPAASSGLSPASATAPAGYSGMRPSTGPGSPGSLGGTSSGGWGGSSSVSPSFSPSSGMPGASSSLGTGYPSGLASRPAATSTANPVLPAVSSSSSANNSTSNLIPADTFASSPVSAGSRPSSGYSTTYPSSSVNPAPAFGSSSGTLPPGPP
jgi:hypothetical protein